MLGRGPAAVLVEDVGQHHRRPLGREQPPLLGALPACAPRDQRDLAVQSPHGPESRTDHGPGVTPPWTRLVPMGMRSRWCAFVGAVLSVPVALVAAAPERASAAAEPATVSMEFSGDVLIHRPIIAQALD